MSNTQQANVYTHCGQTTLTTVNHITHTAIQHITERSKHSKCWKERLFFRTQTDTANFRGLPLCQVTKQHSERHSDNDIWEVFVCACFVLLVLRARACVCVCVAFFVCTWSQLTRRLGFKQNIFQFLLGYSQFRWIRFPSYPRCIHMFRWPLTTATRPF